MSKTDNVPISVPILFAQDFKRKAAYSFRSRTLVPGINSDDWIRWRNFVRKTVSELCQNPICFGYWA
jgi:hypothetical protein